MGDLSASQASLEMATSVLQEKPARGAGSRRPSALALPGLVRVAEERMASSPLKTKAASTVGLAHPHASAPTPSSPLAGGTPGSPTRPGPGPKAKPLAVSGPQRSPQQKQQQNQGATASPVKPKILVDTANAGGVASAMSARAAPSPTTPASAITSSVRPAKSDKPVTLADLASVLEDGVQSIYALDNAFRDEGRIYRHLQTIKVGSVGRVVRATGRSVTAHPPPHAPNELSSHSTQTTRKLSCHGNPSTLRPSEPSSSLPSSSGLRAL
jgi:hypothetical protein